MIESSILPFSIWDTEEPLEHFSETPFESFDNFSLNSERSCLDGLSNDEISSSSFPPNYDSTYFEFDKFLPVFDSFSDTLDESSSIKSSHDQLSFLQDLDFNLLDDENITKNSLSSIGDSPKKAEKPVDFMSNKSWSNMKSDEQLSILNEISKIVTSMDIKNQIKVIKVISPTAKISPDDREFALDISSLNDAKIKRIKDLVRKHMFSISNSAKKLKSSSKSSNIHTLQKPSHSSKLLSRRTNAKSKRRQKKDESCPNKAISQKRKLELHGQKEIESGLFVYEKVIKLSNPTEDEEEVVNILE